MNKVIETGVGVLYIVATPIGNLEDITLRALRVFKEVDIIVCEDTRTTQKLLKNYNISNQLYSWHANSSSAALEKILSWLNEGKKIAYVSDAGTPGVSDPGMLLVHEVRANLPRVLVQSVPGPSALTAAISVSGISMSQFRWLGFLPHKKGREKILTEALKSTYPTVFFESTHRIEKLMQQIIKLEELSGSDKNITLCKELTKIYETVTTAKAKDHLQQLQEDNNYKKGEFVVILH